MYVLLLTIIYVAFISMGLPDSLIGAGWPVMHTQIGASLSSAGITTTVVCIGTIVSSLFTDKLVRKLGTGLVTTLSVLLSAISLFGYSISKTFLALLLWSIPYGLGAGAIDASLNNYVALHYSSKHMNWLHGFWGVGVSISPYIMSFCLANQLGWNMGFRSVSYIQFALAIFMIITLPVWKKMHGPEQEENVESVALPLKKRLALPGAVWVLVAFFIFCSFEVTAGLWASSYMVEYRHVDVETAARVTALFYLGETVGRFLTGLITDKFGDRKMIRTGIIVMISGSVMLLVPTADNTLTLVGFVVLGLGAAPVYPCIMHSTPDNFGKENSQSIIGLQMASAYLGCTAMPLLFGVIVEKISISTLPVFLAITIVLLVLSVVALNSAVDRNRLEK